LFFPANFHEFSQLNYPDALLSKSLALAPLVVQRSMKFLSQLLGEEIPFKRHVRALPTLITVGRHFGYSAHRRVGTWTGLVIAVVTLIWSPRNEAIFSCAQSQTLIWG